MRDEMHAFGRINEHYHANGYLGEVWASHSLGKMTGVYYLGSCYTSFSNYYFMCLTFLVLQMIHRLLAFCSMRASIDRTTCTLSFSIENICSPAWCVLPFPLCYRLPHNPTLLCCNRLWNLTYWSRV